MEYAAALLILAVLVAAVVIGPLRRPGVEERVTRGWDAHLLRFPSP